MSKTPNELEVRTLAYVRAHHGNARFLEDDPPDILLNDSIAVEVTRLSQVLDAPSKLKVEGRTISIAHSLSNVIADVKREARSGTIYVHCDYQTALEVAQVRSELKQALRGLPFSEAANGEKREVGEHLKLGFTWSPAVQSSPFCLGSLNCEEAGGWVIESLLRDLQRVMNEKKERIQKTGRHHDQHWLAVGTAMITGLSPQEIATIHVGLDPSGFWERLILISSPCGDEVMAVELEWPGQAAGKS